MSRPRSWIAPSLGLAGAVSCSFAVTAFLARVRANEIAEGEIASRDYYLSVGHAYSGGFATGFFLCLSLVLLGLGAAAWIEARRRPRGVSVS